MLGINTLKQISRTSRFYINYSNILQNRNLTRNLVLKYKKEYTDSEEWLYHSVESTKMGLTKKAIEELSELVYIEFLHEKGSIVKKNEDIVEIESVKATNSIIAPFDLVLLQNNLDIENNLENINNDPENIETSWIIKVDKIP
jgi:glycine cleavage system H lipoate-binding protein